MLLISLLTRFATVQIIVMSCSNPHHRLTTSGDIGGDGGVQTLVRDPENLRSAPTPGPNYDCTSEDESVQEGPVAWPHATILLLHRIHHLHVLFHTQTSG